MALRSCLHTASRLISALLLIAMCAHAIAWHKRERLPLRHEILPRLLENPGQAGLNERPFVFRYRNKGYTVVPHASYRLCGLLVSQNDIHSIFDAYHTHDSVDIKDVCVIWGGNLSEFDYHKARFWNETWTCHIRVDDHEVWQDFRGEELSNNHLLAGSESVERAILSARPGDQVCFEGRLVDYSPVGEPEFVRATSLVREDMGNGACEVVLVDSFRVIKAGTPGWNRLSDVSWRWGLILLALKVISFLVFPIIEYRWG